ncbi:uncharacterized protein LOC123319544 isoform X2 [Coccinella septempunctata]|uniref:uncharacterized protein LOC123319544 isoform X2 n=1 Tax=Coccinella septempunctata TaxID=41139 RepID=UPI001D06E95D|nr:uncharacterized protein LOC123319544 isoform X2 [Coccinella septempunctata]
MHNKGMRITRSTRKRKVSQPRSNDSGVSLKFSNILNVVSSNTEPSAAKIETNKNLELSSKGEEIKNSYNSRKSDQEYTPAPDRNRLAFVEDEDCLDYEPSEGEDSDKSYSAKGEGEQPEDIDEQITQSIPTVPLKKCDESHEYNSSNNVIPDHFISFSNRPDSLNIESKTCNNNIENVTMENDQNDSKFQTEDELLEEDFSPNEEIESYDENRLLYEEDQEPINKKLFDDAKVNFKGALNITITRPVLNTSQNEVYSQNSRSITAEENSNTFPITRRSPNVQIYNISTIQSRVSENEFSVKRKHEKLSGSSSSRVVHDNIETNHGEKDGCRNSSRVPCEDETDLNYFRPMTNSVSTQNENPFISPPEKKWRREENQPFLGSIDSCDTYVVKDQKRRVNNNFHSQEGSESRFQDVGVQKTVSTPLRFSSSDLFHSSRDEDPAQENEKKEYIARWLMQSNEDNFSQLLESLCESHFTVGCNDVRCSRTHSLEEIRKIIHQANFQEFNKLYRIALTQELWFMWLFDIFLECFKVTPRVGEVLLMDMIDDVYKVFNGTFTDKTSYIIRIIEGLRNMGYSLRDAVERILVKYGTSQLWICDILLFVIAKEPNLEENWCLVQKITWCRKEQIDHEVVTELLMGSLQNYPLNKELCKKIYNDIFEKNLVDLNKIPRHLWEIVTKMSGVNVKPKRKDVSSNSSSTESCTTKDAGQLNSPVLGEQQRKALGFDRKSSPDLVLLDGEQRRKSSSFDRKSSPDLVLYDGEQRRKSSSFDRKSSSDLVPYDCSRASSCSPIPVIKDHDDVFHGQIAFREDAFKGHIGYSPKMISKESVEYKKRQTSTPSDCSSGGINERVVRKFIESLSGVSKSQTPANFIAHPSCQPTIHPNFQCNSSLHNLFPEVYSCDTDISIDDIRRLSASLKETDSVALMDVLKSYSSPYTIENFIVNVLTLIKSIKQGHAIFKTFMALLDDLEKEPDYMNNMYMKVLVEVLALNLIYMLDAKGKWDLCRNILMKIKDWHNLVTSKIFLRKTNTKSHMGRYIYLINVLISAEDFSWVNELFQAKALNLLGPPSSWPFDFKPSDEEARNKALKSFFDKGFPKNIFIANDLLKSIILMNAGFVSGFDLWEWFNNKLLSLMENQDANRSLLLLLSYDISSHYERYMDGFVLQAYMLHMHDHVQSEEALKLFKLCCKKGVYPDYTGEERVLYVSTNLTNFEITSLLHCFVEKFRTGRAPPHDFHIELMLPEGRSKELKIIERKFRISRNVYKVFETICLILETKYHILINQPIQSRIFISQMMLYKLLMTNEKKGFI